MSSVLAAAAAAAAPRAVRKIAPRSTALLVCDIQERFRGIIHGFPSMLKSSQLLVGAALQLGMPIVVTEQYPRGLGHTVGELSSMWAPSEPAGAGGDASGIAASGAAAAAAAAAAPAVFEKSKFSMVTDEVRAHIAELGCTSCIVCGIECHICVLQTTLDLLEMGIDVQLPADAISSCRDFDRSTGFVRLASSGAIVTSAESVVFQLVGDSAHPKFKACSAMVKAHGEYSKSHELSHL